MGNIILKRLYKLLFIKFIIIFFISFGIEYVNDLTFDFHEFLSSLLVAFIITGIAYFFLRKDIKIIKNNDKNN